MIDLRHNYDMDNAKDLGTVWPSNDSFALLNKRIRDRADSLGIDEVPDAERIYDNNRGVEIRFNKQLNAYWTYNLS